MQKKMWKDLVKNQHGSTMCQFPEISPKRDFQPASCFLHKNSLQLFDKNEDSSAERASLSSHSRTSTQTHLGYGRFVNVIAWWPPKFRCHQAEMQGGQKALPPLHFCLMASKFWRPSEATLKSSSFELFWRDVFFWNGLNGGRFGIGATGEKWSDSSSIVKWLWCRRACANWRN